MIKLFQEYDGDKNVKDDIEDFINTYGYGDCHLLSQYLSSKYNFDIGLIFSEPSGHIVHSFVFINDKFSFDSHGFDTIENTVNRYVSFSEEFGDPYISYERLCYADAIIQLRQLSFFDNDDIKRVEEHLNDVLTHFDIDNFFKKFNDKRSIISFIENKIIYQLDKNLFEEDIKSIQEWMSVDNINDLNIEKDIMPINLFMKQINEMESTFEEYPDDYKRTDTIYKIIIDNGNIEPLYINKDDPDRFVMEGRHRMVAFKWANIDQIPVIKVSLNKKNKLINNIRPKF